MWPKPRNAWGRHQNSLGEELCACGRVVTDHDEFCGAWKKGLILPGPRPRLCKRPWSVVEWACSEGGTGLLNTASRSPGEHQGQSECD